MAPVCLTMMILVLMKRGAIFRMSERKNDFTEKNYRRLAVYFDHLFNADTTPEEYKQIIKEIKNYVKEYDVEIIINVDDEKTIEKLTGIKTIKRPSHEMEDK